MCLPHSSWKKVGTHDEVEAGVVNVLDAAAEVPRGPSWKRGFEVRKLGHPRPDFLVGRAQNAEDAEQLVDFGVALNTGKSLRSTVAQVIVCEPVRQSNNVKLSSIL